MKLSSTGSLLIKSLDLKAIYERISLGSKLLVFKSLNNHAPQYSCSLFTRLSECTSLNLRNTATDLRVPMSSSQRGQKYFSYHCAKLWNDFTDANTHVPYIVLNNRFDFHRILHYFPFVFYLLLLLLSLTIVCTYVIKTYLYF